VERAHITGGEGRKRGRKKKKGNELGELSVGGKVRGNGGRPQFVCVYAGVHVSSLVWCSVVSWC
jgi:hypothetical protein